MTEFQKRILRRAQQVAEIYPVFTADDVADRLTSMGEGVSRTSAIDVALNYLAADRRLIRVRPGVFRLVTDVVLPARRAVA